MLHTVGTRRPWAWAREERCLEYEAASDHDEVLEPGGERCEKRSHHEKRRADEWQIGLR